MKTAEERRNTAVTLNRLVERHLMFLDEQLELSAARGATEYRTFPDKELIQPMCERLAALGYQVEVEDEKVTVSWA